MRIAHYYADMFYDGGCPSNLRSLAEAQMELGHDVSGFGFTHPDRNHEMPVGMSTSDAMRTPGGLRRLIEEILAMRPRPDVVQVWSPLIPGNEYALWRLHRAGLITAVTLQGHLDPFLYRKGNRLAKGLYRLLVLGPSLRRWTSVSHAQSPYEARLARAMGVTRPIHVFPLGTPSKALPGLGERPGPLRRSLGMGADGLLAGFFGRFDPVQKRFDALLPALARCRELTATTGVRFVVAGKGTEAQRAILVERIARYGLDDLVSLSGPFDGDDRFRALADLDVLIHPSRYEGLPRVIREAASVGTPAVVTVQTNAELLVEAGGALLTGPTPAEIAFAVSRAVTDEAWRASASSAGRSWASENDWVTCARHFDGAYADALAMHNA